MRDPIEETKKFQDVIKRIQPELNEISEELDKRGLGIGKCHVYWAKKKEILKREGIDWKSPLDLNPDILFD